MTATNLPANIQAEAIDLICRWFDGCADRLTAEATQQSLMGVFLEALRGGTLGEACVIAAAQDLPEADLALRLHAGEMFDHYREREMSAQLRGYAVGALVRPLVRKDGHPNTWRRNCVIVVLVQMTASHWNLPAKLHHHSKKSLITASTLVKEALARRGIYLTERSISDIYDKRGQIAEKLAATIRPMLLRTSAT